MKRGGHLRNGLCSFLVGGSVAWLPSVPGCDVVPPEIIDIAIEDHTRDVSPPPLGESRYAEKYYGAMAQVVNSPEFVLHAGDGVYTTYEITRENPLVVVVGFARQFEKVIVSSYQTAPLRVRGSAGVPVIRAGIGDYEIGYFGFVRHPHRKTPDEGLVVSPVSQNVFGGEINLSTGGGDERIVIFEAWPERDEKVLMGIDCFAVR